MSRLTCSVQEFNDAVISYQNNPDVRKHQRLGQYIWNSYGKEGESWPEFFYEENPNTVIGLGTVETIMGQPVERVVEDF